MTYKKIIVQQSTICLPLQSCSFYFIYIISFHYLFNYKDTYIYLVYTALSKTLMRESCAVQRLKKLLYELVRALKPVNLCVISTWACRQCVCNTYS